MQDFRELNKHSYMDKYLMKEINECIGDIGRAKSTIFTTLGLTSGFWQMPLEEHSRAPTEFTIPGLGQFEWVTSPNGTTWMSGIISKIDGNDFQKYQKCHCLH